MNALKHRKERNELERIMKIRNNRQDEFKEQQVPSKKLKIILSL